MASKKTIISKKAIIIILILFLIIAIAFAVLYIIKKQAATPGDELNANQNGQTGEIKKNKTAVEGEINKIIEAAKKNPKANPDAVRQEIISTINAEIIKQKENKTPEQKAADLKAQEERQKIIDKINSQIKQQAGAVK